MTGLITKYLSRKARMKFWMPNHMQRIALNTERTVRSCWGPVLKNGIWLCRLRKEAQALWGDKQGMLIPSRPLQGTIKSGLKGASLAVISEMFPHRKSGISKWWRFLTSSSAIDVLIIQLATTRHYQHKLLKATSWCTYNIIVSFLGKPLFMKLPINLNYLPCLTQLIKLIWSERAKTWFSYSLWKAAWSCKTSSYQWLIQSGCLVLGDKKKWPGIKNFLWVLVGPRAELWSCCCVHPGTALFDV